MKPAKIAQRLLFVLALFPCSITYAQEEEIIDMVDFPMGDIAQQAASAQNMTPQGLQSQFTSALGLTVIDDETFIALRLQPDISIGKFGIGLDVPLMFNLDGGDFRSEEFEDGVGVARVLRYARYGQRKRDPVYIKVGDISGTTLGFGFVMYQYSGTGSFEKRPIGTEFDLNYHRKVGVEGLYSDFSGASVLGVRPYFRPLRLANKNIPFLRNLEVGFVFATDQADNATPGGSSLSIWGADIGLPIALSPMVSVVPYAAYASVANFDEGTPEMDGSEAFSPGQGAAVGVNVNINFVANVFSLGAKLERRFFEEHFVGSYFDANYEANKFGGTPPLSKLAGADGTDGTFGSLYGHVIDKVLLGGALFIPDEIGRDALGNVTHGGSLRLEASAPDLIPSLVTQAVYNRNFIEDVGDAIVLDENSTLNLRAGYQARPYLLVGVNYLWTFARVENNGVEQIEATSYVFPFVALQFNFSAGSL